MTHWKILIKIQDHRKHSLYISSTSSTLTNNLLTATFYLFKKTDSQTRLRFLVYCVAPPLAMRNSQCTIQRSGWRVRHPDKTWGWSSGRPEAEEQIISTRPLALVSKIISYSVPYATNFIIFLNASLEVCICVRVIYVHQPSVHRSSSRAKRVN